jgi:hypothetical protein
MQMSATTLQVVGRQRRSALVSLLLVCGLIVGSASILPRALNEQEHEAQTHVLCTAKAEASGADPGTSRGTLARQRARQSYASGLQSRHTNSEPSRRNGKGCHLLL